MARKSAGTLQQQRNRIKRDYKRGVRAEKVIKGEAALTEMDRTIKQEVAVFLKAQDFSWSYIGEGLGVSPNTVKSWFNREGDPRAAELRDKVVAVQKNFVDGGIRLMKTYFIELAEMLMVIARTTDDEKIVVEIFREFADRIGAVKVNKSESAALNLNRNEENVNIDITDQTGLIAKLEGAPPEIQQAAAQKMAEFMALVSEGVVIE